MAPRTALILAAAALPAIAAAPVSAQQKGGDAPIEGVPVKRKVGAPAGRAYRDKYINNILEFVKSEATVIAGFINTHGCVPMGKERKAINAKALEMAVRGIAAKTEVAFVTLPEMRAITGKQRAHALGLTAELKAAFAAETGMTIGTPGKNSIVLKSVDGKPPKASELNDEDPGGWPGRHEFLHILLRSLDNPELGGGDAAQDIDPRFANAHHALTDYLRWTQFKQSSQDWKPPADPSVCASAAAPREPKTEP